MSCRDCKHWDRDGKGYEYGWGEENDFQGIEAPHRLCTLIKLGDRYEPGSITDSKPFTRDASSYKADLWTPGAFSCALFEAREENKVEP